MKILLVLVLVGLSLSTKAVAGPCNSQQFSKKLITVPAIAAKRVQEKEVSSVQGLRTP